MNRDTINPIIKQYSATPILVKENATPKSESNFLQRSLQYFGAGTATSLISYKTFMKPFMEAGMDWCPEFPKPLYSYARNVCLVRKVLPDIAGTLGELVIKAPIIEEMIYRVGIQEFLLKQLPKTLLKKTNPSFVGVVDSKVAKISRVALTALAFSLIHAMPPEMGWPNCSAAKLINTFAFGVLY